MTPLKASSLVVGLMAAFLLAGAVAGRAQPPEADTGAPRYDAQGRLLPPTDYREWVFLSSGLNMNYNPGPEAAGMDMFGNTFAPRAAYAVFRKTGAWPDKTMIVLENRAGATKGSINKSGRFQTTATMGAEAHVKDTARFKGGWGFFTLDGAKPSTLIPYTAACYSCHQQHAAVDTTFVQFYPTLLPIAEKLGTLSAAYKADEARRGKP